MVEQRVPGFVDVYQRLGWQMFPSIGRVYVNRKARTILGWQPRYDFKTVLESLDIGQDPHSPLTREIGAKGYHAETFTDGPYPVE